MIASRKYDKKKGLDWEWQAMDGAMTKAPLGGKGTGPNPTDRVKSGTKQSLLTEGNGIPLAVAVDGANRHDMKLVEATLKAMVIERSEPLEGKTQNMSMDKGYDYPEVRELVAAWGYTAHIRARGEEAAAKKQIPGSGARRWVVERTHSWLNRFRRLLICWEKKVENCLAMLHFACAWITFKAAELFGFVEKVKVTNFKDPSKSIEREAVIDTGATMSVLPMDLIQERLDLIIEPSARKVIPNPRSPETPMIEIFSGGKTMSRPLVEVEISGKKLNAILDTGSRRSYIRKEHVGEFPKAPVEPFGVMLGRKAYILEDWGPI